MTIVLEGMLEVIDVENGDGSHTDPVHDEHGEENTVKTQDENEHAKERRETHKKQHRNRERQRCPGNEEGHPRRLGTRWRGRRKR